MFFPVFLSVRATDGPDRGARRGPHVVDEIAVDDAFKRTIIMWKVPATSG